MSNRWKWLFWGLFGLVVVGLLALLALWSSFKNAVSAGAAQVGTDMLWNTNQSPNSQAQDTINITKAAGGGIAGALAVDALTNGSAGTAYALGVAQGQALGYDQNGSSSTYGGKGGGGGGFSLGNISEDVGVATAVLSLL